MDWVLQTLAIAGVTVALLGGFLLLSARGLGAGRPLEGASRALTLSAHPGEGAEQALRRWRRPWFDRGVEASALMDRGTHTIVVLGFRGRRWELMLATDDAAAQARLTGPEGTDADDLLEILSAAIEVDPRVTPP